MKTLIVTLLSNILIGVNAQTSIVPKQTVIVKAPTLFSWQVSTVLPLPEGCLLIGQSQNKQADAKTILLKIDNHGEVQKKNELQFPSATTACLHNNLSIVFLNSTNEKAFLTKIANADATTPLWQTELAPSNGGVLASMENGQIALATDTENFTKVQFFTGAGKLLKDILLKKAIRGILPKSRIIALNNGTWAVVGGGMIWGLADNGETIWQFGSESIKINWQNIRQLTNGDMVAIGSGKSELFDPTNEDIYIWSIAKDGAKINWTSIIGEDQKQDIAYDLVETPTNELIILASKNGQTQLIRLNQEHQPSIAYAENTGNKNTNLRFLIANQSNNWLAIGNTYSEGGKKIIIQGFGQEIIQQETLKPMLQILSIGVNGQSIQYAKHDAKVFSNLYKKKAIPMFATIQTQTLLDDSSTKAGELAKKFELLSSTQDLQEKDLLIVYFSGNGMKLEDDYLLLGSDFDPAALHSTSLRFSQILKYLDNIPCRKLLVLDACFSGGVAKLHLPKNVSILTSSTADQTSFEYSDWQHGALTKVVIEALSTSTADTNYDSYITLNELFDFTKSRLPALTRHKYMQNPVLLHKGEDFVIFEK